MMIRPSDEDLKIMDELDKWFVVDREKQEMVLREDTPEDLKKENERLKKKYRWFID